MNISKNLRDVHFFQKLNACETDQHMALKYMCGEHCYTFGIDISLGDDFGFPGILEYPKCVWM